MRQIFYIFLPFMEKLYSTRNNSSRKTFFFLRNIVTLINLQWKNSDISHFCQFKVSCTSFSTIGSQIFWLWFCLIQFRHIRLKKVDFISEYAYVLIFMDLWSFCNYSNSLNAFKTVLHQKMHHMLHGWSKKNWGLEFLLLDSYLPCAIWCTLFMKQVR